MLGLDPPVSATALHVHLHCALLAADPDLGPWIEDPRAEPLARALSAGVEQWLSARATDELRRAHIASIERDAPGLVTHLVYRKRWFAAQARAAVADGCRQVVVLGAGFDTLALRLADEAPEVAVFEVDLPAMLAVKRRAVEAGFGARPSIRYVPLDLASDEVMEPLRAAGLDPSVPTACIAEAVMEYLPPRGVDALLGFARAGAGDASRLVLTFTDGHIFAAHPLGQLQALLAGKGARVTFTLRPADLESHLRERGLRLLAARSSARLLADLGAERRSLRRSPGATTTPRARGRAVRLRPLDGLYFAVAQPLR